jgi:mono/diheme cytochrome c family protein
MLAGCRGTGKEPDAGKGNAGESVAVPEPDEKENTVPEYMVQGEKIYSQYCLVCHQATGSGVPGLNPPLKQTDYVTGDPDRLLGIILNGSNEGLVVNGSTYANAMPAFHSLSDEDIAHVTSYIRNSFGNTAPAITPPDVKSYRSGE